MKLWIKYLRCKECNYVKKVGLWFNLMRWVFYLNPISWIIYFVDKKTGFLEVTDQECLKELMKT